MKKLLLVLSVIFVSMSAIYAEQIRPITREMGSGTRSAFVDIFDIKAQRGSKKVDAISQKAEVTNSTGVMILSVSNAKNAIGYISLGSLNERVKALKIDGVAPSVANVGNKSYKIVRPFNVAFKRDSKNALIADFLRFTRSKNAVQIIQKAGYIALPSDNQNAPKSPRLESYKKLPTAPQSDYKSQDLQGKLVIAGSSSITPLMEKLQEAYIALNPRAEVEILQSDSTMGINATSENIADIAMVSRELTSSEIARGLVVQVLAMDALVVIVNKNNALENLRAEAIKQIFLGQITKWSELK